MTAHCLLTVILHKWSIWYQHYCTIVDSILWWEHHMEWRINRHMHTMCTGVHWHAWICTNEELQLIYGRGGGGGGDGCLISVCTTYVGWWCEMVMCNGHDWQWLYECSHLGRSGRVSEDGIEKGIGDVLMVLSTAANLSTQHKSNNHYIYVRMHTHTHVARCVYRLWYYCREVWFSFPDIIIRCVYCFQYN